MTDLDVESGFVFCSFNWETVNGYRGTVVKSIRNDVYFSLRDRGCEPLLVA